MFVSQQPDSVWLRQVKDIVDARGCVVIACGDQTMFTAISNHDVVSAIASNIAGRVKRDPPTMAEMLGSSDIKEGVKPTSDASEWPRRFRKMIDAGEMHPNGRYHLWRYGTYFPFTDLVVWDMGERMTGEPQQVEWIDPDVPPAPSPQQG